MVRNNSVTLSYVADEDRLLVALQGQGRAVRLWLTQRLSRSLVAALAADPELFEPLAEIGSQPAEPSPADQPACARPWPSAHLVHQVSLKRSAERLALCFDTDLDVRSNLVLDRSSLRQWLRILHRQFVAANWPLDVWPSGMAHAGAPANQRPTLH